jgi:tetratricopeptide (TPR) repeat protein
MTHYNLGLALDAQGKREDAIAVYRVSARLKPTDPLVHNNLGNDLRAEGKLEEAIGEFRLATQLDPDFALAHRNLGLALQTQGDYSGATAAYREALRLKPDDVGAHQNLGMTLRAQGELAAAIAESREAIRLEPNNALGHCNLGISLRNNGEYAESLAEYRRGHELGSKQTGWSYPSAEWIRQGERFVSLSRRLPAVLKGEDRPADSAERLAFGAMAFHSRHYVASAQLYAEAFEADPRLADDLKESHRYNAAFSAALAGVGKGDDDPPPDDAARANLRRLAREWLRADLVLWRTQLDTGTIASRQVVRAMLAHWKGDAGLAGVRETTALNRLPEDERQAWRDLWAEVDALLTRARGDRP